MSFTYIRSPILHHFLSRNVLRACLSTELGCTCRSTCSADRKKCQCFSVSGGCAYTPDGLLQSRFIKEFVQLTDGGNAHLVHCRGKFLCKGFWSGACPGHVQRLYIQECTSSCQCSRQCGNRVIQAGVTKRFEVYFVSASKGWGIRTLELLRQGTFLFEYAGEVVTNAELFRRGGGKKYSLLLDAHWQSEASKSDKELLCIDSSQCTNLARWVNHRCGDANVMDMPVWVGCTLPTVYHVAFFAKRDIAAGEEIT